VDPSFDDQSCTLTVLSWDRARLRIDALGWQPKGPPCSLGCALLDLRSARVNLGLDDAGTPVRVSVPLTGPGGGGQLDLTLVLTDLSETTTLPAPPPGGVVDALQTGFLASQRSVKASADAASLEVMSCGEHPIPAPIECATPAAAAAAAASTPPITDTPASPPPPAEQTQAAAAQVVAEPDDDEQLSAISSPPATSLPAAPSRSPSPIVAPPASVASPRADTPVTAFSPLSSSSSPTAAHIERVATLHVRVYKGAHLPADVQSDPFMRLRMGTASADTGVRRRMVDPDFNGQLLKLPLQSWEEDDSTLTITALGWLPDSVDPVFLGAAQLDVRHLAATGVVPWTASSGADATMDVALGGVPAVGGSVSISLSLHDVTTPPPQEAPLPRVGRTAALQTSHSPGRLPDADGFVEVQLETPEWAMDLETPPTPPQREATSDVVSTASAAPAQQKTYSAPARRRRNDD